MKMYNEIELITKDEHIEKGVKNITGFTHAKELSSSMITINEYYESCKHYPIVFAKNEEEGWFSVALFGLEKINTFITKKDMWKENCYVPAYIRRYPFIYIKNENDLLLGFDAKHKVNKKDSNDRYFFDDKGEKSEFVHKVIAFMNQVQNSSKETQKFIQTLVDLELLEESNITGKNAQGKEIALNGFWILKEEKLEKLTEKKRAILCKQNYMQPITAHLISLSNIQKLA